MKEYLNKLLSIGRKNDKFNNEKKRNNMQFVNNRDEQHFEEGFLKLSQGS